MEYKVRYEDSTGNGSSIKSYASTEAAEAAIAEEFEEVEEYFRGRNYGYVDFMQKDGLATEIRSFDDNEWASWTRLWK